LSRNDRENAKSVALYWDFENLHASLVEARMGEGAYNKPDGRFKSQEPLIEIQAIVELASSFGPIAINRAYCNWQYFGRYRDALLQGAVELIQLFSPGASAKNGADIKLCLDAVEDVGRFGHIETVVIVGGDSDFMPLSQKIKAAGRTLIGVGTRKSTNRHWAKSCHEFRYYENVLEALSPEMGSPSDQPFEPVNVAAEMFKRAIRLLAETQGDSWVTEGAVWHMIKRLDPTFEPRDHGHSSFMAMLHSLGAMVETRPGESEQLVRLR
jgi:uncharacterized LabA/DUF88 family protein